jgi:hypothetical protein
MTVLQGENLSDVRLQETAYETDQDTEQLIPATIGISCHFDISGFDRELAPFRPPGTSLKQGDGEPAAARHQADCPIKPSR